MNITKKMKSIFIASILICTSNTSFGYKVWLGTHQWDGVAAQNLDQWDMALEKIEGINYVFNDKRTDKKATLAEWRTMVRQIDHSVHEMAEIARSQFTPAKNFSMSSRLQQEFDIVEGRGGEINVLMLYDEASDGIVYNWTEDEFQDVRDWLDSHGHRDVTLSFDVRANGDRFKALARNPLIDEILIEASATKWVDNENGLHTVLKDFWTDPRTNYKPIYFQIPRSEDNANYNQYQETRRALKTINELMGDDFMRSDRVGFIICNYSDRLDTYPETSNNDTRYVNSKSGIALSLIEQRPIFEGRTGVLDEAFCVSYDRYDVPISGENPTSGLVAHWPLDEGSGTVVSNTAGSSYTAVIENGATWGSDATRDSYVSFDGVNDRIATTFKYALADTNDFTWAWWAKSTLASTDATQKGSIMVGNRYPDRASPKYGFIKMTPEGAQFANTDAADEIDKYNYADIPQNEWHHYAMVKDGTSYQWYVDGIAQGVSSNFVYNETSPIPLMIGGDDDGSGTKVNEHFQGFIDDVVLYREALTSTQINGVINGDYLPIITMVQLGGTYYWNEGAAWSDGQPAHGGFEYIIPDTGQLRSEDGTSTFPGTSLTVEAGARLQVRSVEGDGELTTIDRLILEGGAAGNYADLTAGTGSDLNNVLDGKITNSGHSRLLSFHAYSGGVISRSLKVLSVIEGSGVIQAAEGSEGYGGENVIIDNAANTFSGTWEVGTASTLIFNNAEAIGTSDIKVLDTGKLQISGSWNAGATLTVADTATTQVDLGIYTWIVSDLILGGTSVGDGLYTAADLNALGDAVFTGAGTLRVGERSPDEPIAHWKLDEGSGTVATDSSGSGYTGAIINGATWGSDATRDSYVSFDGSNDRITTPFTYALSSSDNFTWAWWANNARPATDTTQKNSIMVGNRYPEYGTNERYEFIKLTPTKAAFANTDDSGTIEDSDYADVPQGGWHHYAMVKTGTSYQWYVDGVAQGAPVTINYDEPSPIPFLIGGDDDGSGTKVNEHFQGFIDDVVLYDRSLEASEVLNVRDGIYFGVEPNIPPVLELGMSGGDMSFSWSNGVFKLQFRTNLTEGAWEDYPGGSSGSVIVVPTNPASFFRLIEQ